MMEFTKVGKTYQVVIRNGADLKNVLELDEALWGATSAPANVFKCDPMFISHLDPAKTGRITSNQLKDLITYMLGKVSSPEAITTEFDGKFPLSGFSDAAADLKVSAEYILDSLKAADKASITLSEVREFLANIAKLPLNGDGVISATAAGLKSQLPGFIADVITATDGTQDADGTQGASEQNIKDFLAAAADYLAWVGQGRLAEGAASSEIKPFGEETAALASKVKALQPKIDQFFTVSGLLGFDSRIQANVLAPENKVVSFDPAQQDKVSEYLADLPIAQPNSKSILSFDLNTINPGLRGAFGDLVTTVLKRILGADVTEMSPEDWHKVTATFAPYEAYMASKKGGIVEAIPQERLASYVNNESIVAEYTDILAEEKKVTDILKGVRDVEKLLLCCMNLVRFANNYVSFPDLYSPKCRALFECGSLVIDGRWFKLAFNVENMAAHQALAKNSLLCTIYADVLMDGGKTMTVVVPVTFGSIGNLAVGKRGIFFDLDGKEYDAVIKQLITNPVCIREALFAPFVKMRTMVEGKIENWSGNSEKALTDNFNKVLSDPSKIAEKPAEEKPANGAAPAKGAGDKSGMLLGASVAVAALSSAFAFVSKTLSNMSSAAIWITIISALIVLLAPISIMAIVKLRKQDLSALLEGSGWAINLHMKLTTPLRGHFTKFGVYPKDATGTPRKRHFLWIILVVLVLVVWGVIQSGVLNNLCCSKKCETPVPAVAATATSSAPAAAAPAAPVAPAAPAVPEAK